MPHTIGDFSPTNPTAIEIYTFRFASRLAPGEALLTSTWTISVLNGTDNFPSLRLIGSSDVSNDPVYGWITLQTIGNCMANVTYLVTATVTTSQSQTLVVYTELYCQAPI